MRILIRTLLVCLSLIAAQAFAGSGADYSTTATESSTGESQSPFPFEFDAEYTYIGDSDAERGFRKVRDFDENYLSARALYTPRIAVGILRLGAAYERYEFGLPAFSLVHTLPLIPGEPRGFLVGRPQIPGTLQSVSAVIGLDTRFSDSILFRIEAQPGFYGTRNLSGDTFNVPVVLGGTYIYNTNLQFILGASIDYERKYPVFPGGGVRWRFASQWVLNAALPTPRLEYEVNNNVTLYAGADVKGSTFRVSDDFGVARGDRRLNRAILTYSEIRTGAGVDWKITPDLKLSVEGGYLPYRQFDYYRADVRYTQRDAAPYGSVAFRAAF